jgi:hypothetical protein
MVSINKCFQRLIIDVLSRYRSIPGEHMRNHENNKYDSGRIHPGIYKNKQCVLPLSTQKRVNNTRYLETLRISSK